MFNLFSVNFSKTKTSPVFATTSNGYNTWVISIFSIAFIVVSLPLPKKGPLFEYLAISRFCTEKKKNHSKSLQFDQF